MARLHNDDINRVRASANISEVISQYIPIEKKGRNFVAVCPFHEDNNPSLTISEEKQIYKCFVCGAGGNVFTFVANYTNVSFVESVVEVAEHVNITLDIDDYKPVNKISDELLHYYKITENATNYLNFKLVNNNDKRLDDYVRNRGLTPKEIEYFSIGYESENSLVEFLNKKGYENSELERINLINENEYGVRSVFNNRLIFPIHSKDGHVVGYSARSIIDDDNQAKYINSNENVIYTKGDVLYNYHRAKPNSKRDSQTYLVEGVMDVIGFFQADILNTVASLGTALTDQQAALIKSLSNHVVISYDGDNAGQLATVKAIEILLKHNLTVEVLVGFDDLDPDEYLKKYSKTKFNEAVKKRISYLDFLIRYNKVKYNLDNYEERKEFTVVLSKYLNYIKDDFDKTYFLNEIEKLTNFSASQIDNLKVPDKKPTVKVVRPKVRSNVTNNRSEYNLIGQMLSGKEAALYVRDNLGFLTDSQLNHIYLIIIDYFSRNDDIVIADMISLVDQTDENLSSLFLDILNNDNINKEFDKDIIDESISLIEANLIDDQINILKNTQTTDENKRLDILVEMQKLLLKKSEILRKWE